MHEYQENLKTKMDELVDLVYEIDFPKNEEYGMKSQLRRAVISIILNYIEGYGRRKNLVKLNFWEISYGSLQETKYLIKKSIQFKYITNLEKAELATKVADEIGTMLWKDISNLRETD